MTRSKRSAYKCYHATTKTCWQTVSFSHAGAMAATALRSHAGHYDVICRRYDVGSICVQTRGVSACESSLVACYQNVHWIAAEDQMLNRLCGLSRVLHQHFTVAYPYQVALTLSYFDNATLCKRAGDSAAPSEIQWAPRDLTTVLDILRAIVCFILRYVFFKQSLSSICSWRHGS